MKKAFALLLVLSLLLCGCSELIPSKTTLPAGETAETAEAETAEVETEAETEAETEPETEPAPVYFNPLNGKILDEPYNGRVYSLSINNLQEALPHVGVVDCDIFFETFVNGSIIRGLALYSDPTNVGAIGSIRSDRIMWNDLTAHYDTVMVHAGGSSQVMSDATSRGLDHMSVDVWNLSEDVAFRDKDRQKAGYSYEHTLFAVGSGLPGYAESKGYRTTANPDFDYGMIFAEDATPADGVKAEDFTFTITVGQGNKNATPYRKDTRMVYNTELGAYEYWQYNQRMEDGKTGAIEAYQNVLILEANIGYDGIYQKAKFDEGGEGWFACGGKAERIAWHVDGENSPIRLTTPDGEPLVLNMGRTYIALTRPDYAITGIEAE